MAKQLPRTIRTLGPNRESQPTVPAERRRGRPPIELEERTVELICTMAKFGANDIEIAQEIGVSPDKLYSWYRQWPEFSEAVRAGKEHANERVQRSFYGRATGYNIKTEKVFSNGFRAEVIEHVPADPGAAFNWLKNRDRANWRDRQETEIVVPEQAAGDRPSTRQLALASLALLSQAAYTPEQTTIDVTPNTVEEAEDDATDTYSDAEEAGTEEFDPDFDL